MNVPQVTFPRFYLMNLGTNLNAGHLLVTRSCYKDILLGSPGGQVYIVIMTLQHRERMKVNLLFWLYYC